eukprot:403368931
MESITQQNILKLDISFYSNTTSDSQRHSTIQNFIKTVNQKVSVHELLDDEERCLYEKVIDICSDVTEINRDYIGIMYQGQLLTEQDNEYLGNLAISNNRLRLFVINLFDYENKLDQAQEADKQFWTDFRHQNDLSQLNKASLKYYVDSANTSLPQNSVKQILQSRYGEDIQRIPRPYRRGGQSYQRNSYARLTHNTRRFEQEF